jgi:hypothetical protein
MSEYARAVAEAVEDLGDRLSVARADAETLRAVLDNIVRALAALEERLQALDYETTTELLATCDIQDDDDEEE